MHADLHRLVVVLIDYYLCLCHIFSVIWFLSSGNIWYRDHHCGNLPVLVIGCWIPTKWFVHKPYALYLTVLFISIFHIWLMLSKRFIKLKQTEFIFNFGKLLLLGLVFRASMMYHLLLDIWLQSIYVYHFYLLDI